MEKKHYMRYCPICAQKKENDFGMIYHVSGYIDESIFKLADNKCLVGHDTIKLSMPCEDYQILTHISVEPNFMKSMVDLHDTDIIEYNVKMSHFKTQVEQQKRLEVENYPGPKCPTCSSPDIARISGVDILVDDILRGVYGTLRYKTFHCNHCGYEW